MKNSQNIEILQTEKQVEKVIELERDGDTNYNCFARNVPLGYGKEAKRIGNSMTTPDHLTNSNAMIIQNTEKSSGDLRSFAVTQNPVKDHHQNLVW